MAANVYDDTAKLLAIHQALDWLRSKPGLDERSPAAIALLKANIEQMLGPPPASGDAA